MDPRSIFRREKKGMAKEDHKQELVCWAIWVETELKDRFKVLAAAIGVPLRELITAILEDWLAEYEEVLQDEKTRHRFADFLRRRKRDEE